MWPMQVRKLSARASSSSGGKEYHLVLATSADPDRALLIQRWGKAGKWGQMDVRVGVRSHIEKCFQEKYAEKWRGEYRDHFKDVKDVVNNEAELKGSLGAAYWAKLGADNLRELLPDADTTGVKTPDEGWEPDPNAPGRFRQKHTFKPIVEPEPTVADNIATNSSWGLF